MPSISLMKKFKIPSIVSPGPTLFPTIASAQGNQLGSLPMAAGRLSWWLNSPLYVTATTRPQRNFIGRRMIAVITIDQPQQSPVINADILLSVFLIGSMNQLGSGEPIHLASFMPSATGAAFTMNQTEPGLDYLIGCTYVGRILARDECVSASFTIYGDTVR